MSRHVSKAALGTAKVSSTSSQSRILSRHSAVVVGQAISASLVQSYNIGSRSQSSIDPRGLNWKDRTGQYTNEGYDSGRVGENHGHVAGATYINAPSDKRKIDRITGRNSTKSLRRLRTRVARTNCIINHLSSLLKCSIMFQGQLRHSLK